MSICEEAHASALAGRGSFYSKISLSALIEQFRGMISARRRRRLVVNMRDFDDARLADIGLTRADVETALRLPSMDPTHHLIVARLNPLKGIRHN
jgi:uncharacterized protein YjiS (DUF1127 family)